MAFQRHLQEWWNRLSEDQKARVKEAAEHQLLDASGTQLLLETRCPVGPVGTKWESEPEFGWGWPDSVRQFVIGQ